MTHPHAEHRAHKVEKRRVGHILKGYASGGAVAHDDEAADKKTIRGMVRKSALRMDGGGVKHRADRRARGGRSHKKGTNVTVVVAPQGGGNAGAPMPRPPMAAPPVPPRPMPPPATGPMPPGAIPPGGMPPGGGPSGMPMRAKGGRIKSGPAWEEGKRSGTQVQNTPGKNDTKDIGRGKPITYAAGGDVKPGARLVQFYAGGSVPKRAAGGKVESPQGVAKATKLRGGSGGARARLVKERRAEKSFHPSSAIAS